MARNLFASAFAEIVPFLRVEWPEYGARAYTKDEIEALDGAGEIDAVAAANTVAFQAALDAAAAMGGGTVVASGQLYVLDGTGLRMPQGVKLVGSGVDEWEPVYATRPKGWNGTSLIFKGAGIKTFAFDAVTSMRNSGARREDPDNAGQFFSLFSGYNADAAGVTPASQRLFSAAIAPKPNAKYWGLQGLRVVNWCGQNGIEGWSDVGATSLGDAFDIGVLLIDTEYCDIDSIQAVGGWREFAMLDITEAGAQSSSEQNRVANSKVQGRVGLGFRAMDRWRIDPALSTSDSVRVTWSEEHYFSPAGGTFRGSDNVNYTYSGLSYADPYLVLTGVSPDPAASGIFHLRHAGTGFANTQFDKVYAYDIYHQSGASAAALGLADSKPVEMSGYPLRGVEWRNCKFHTRERVVGHLHDVFDLRMIGGQWEGGGFLIAAPAAALSTAAAPAGETRALFFDGEDGTSQQDLRLFQPRSAHIPSIQIAPEDDLTGNFQLRALRDDQDLELRQRGSGGIVLKDNAGNPFMDLTAFIPSARTPEFAFVAAPAYVNQTGWFRQTAPAWFEFQFDLEWTGLDTSDPSDIAILPPGKTSGQTMGFLITDAIETDGWTLTSPLRLVKVASDTYVGVDYAGGAGLNYNAGNIPVAGLLRARGYYSII